MRLPFLLLTLPLCALATEKALVVDATWDRFSQHTTLRYTHLGTQTRLETTAADKPDPYLLIDTAQDQRVTVYRHNSSWRLDPLEPKPRNDSPASVPGLPARPQPPPGIGPQGQIGPRIRTSGTPPTPSYGAASPAVAQPGTPNIPGAIGPQGHIGPRNTRSPAIPDPTQVPPTPELPPIPQPPAAPFASYVAAPQALDLPSGMGSSAGRGASFGGSMPPPSAMDACEQAPTLAKTEETQPILGRTAVKYTIAGRMLETVEIWAVPDADLGTFFAYRPQPPHRFGPIDLQEQWDSLLRHEQLFPLLAVFKQGDREIARFTVTKIETLELAEPAAFFAPPQKFYRCPPDPF